MAVLAGLAVGAVGALLVVLGTPHQGALVSQPRTTGTALIGGPWSLVDHTGKRVTEKDFAGRHMLVFFAFTSCPDICPSGLQVMSAALDKLGPKADKVTPLLITVDPERDTPQVLAEYVKSFHPRLIGLTGSPEEVAAAAKAYRVYVKKVADEKSAGVYTMEHSAFFYLMDRSGVFLKHFRSTIDPDQLAGELSRLL
jgi:protein SCO1/2